MIDDKNQRGLIRNYLGYLFTDNGFADDSDIDTDDIYSEVKFKKNKWTVSIVTTAHGTKISLSIISPTNDFGFLSHYFKTVDKDYSKTESNTKNLGDNLRFYSEFLKTYGQDIFTADTKRLTEILVFIKKEQIKWVEPLTK